MTANSRRAIRNLRSAACLVPLVLLAGCAATFPSMSTTVQRPDEEAVLAGAPDPIQVETGAGTTRGRRDSLSIPTGGASQAPARPAITDAEIAALIPDELVDGSLPPQPIPQFVATVFGGLLSVPYTLSPDVATRREVISGGTGGTISKRNLFRLTQRALQQYGIEIYADGGFITVGDTSGPTGGSVIRGREAVPGAGRVVQFFTVQSIEIGALQSLLSDLYPELTGVRVTQEPATNSLILSGSGRDVAALVRALREIDQPRFAGAEVLRVEPVYWSAETLTASLNQVLTTEGYVISTQPGITRAITILPFPSANQILIFSEDPALLARARYWVDTLDQPTALGDKTTTFVYQVRNTDAESIGQLAMGQSPAGQQFTPPVGVPQNTGGQPGQPPLQQNGGAQGIGQAASGVGSTSGGFLGGRLISDPTGNRILFTGTASDFAQLRQLLVTLDVPSPQVVIEVMIAEVTLNDNTDIGVELFGVESTGDGTWSGGTLGGLGIGGSGFLGTFIAPDYRARVNASASNSRINILQRPQLVARSGGTARFQVGTDVPVITSQAATDFQPGTGGSQILQSVQYRQTGVILELKPVVYGDRVDITISQEISSAGDPPNSSIASPTILNRSVDTQISIGDGWTGVLGGLISNNYNKSNTGIPFLKDIPIVGSAFQTNTVSGDRTELLLLITPRVLRGDEDMSDLAGRYARDMNAAFRTGRGWSYTLTPFAVGPAFRGVGFDLPSPERASERPALLPRRTPPASDMAPVATEVEVDEATPPPPPSQ